MRARRLLLFGSIITPGSAAVSGCFAASSAGQVPDAGFSGDGPEFQVDSSMPDVPVTPMDAAGQDASDATTPPPASDLTTATIDFGSNDCGTTPPSRTLTFHNTGGSTLTYSASLAKGTAFAIQGTSSGSVAPGKAGSIVLAPAAITSAAVAGKPLADTLHITTNIPGAGSVAVPLSVTPQGGSITVTAAAFGQQFLNTAAPDIAIQVKNVGTKAVSVSIAMPKNTDFGVGWTGAPAAVSVAPNGTLAGAVAHFKPSAAGMESESVAVDVTGPLCAPASPAIAFSGTGTTTPISIGPGMLDFLATPCGATASPTQDVTLTNASAVAVTYTGVLQGGAGSPYTLMNGSGTVPASGKVTITVLPSAVPSAPGSLTAGALNDVLMVTTGPGGGGAALNIPIAQTATGAVLTVSMATTAFGTVTVGSPVTLPFDVTNSGNVPASVTAGTTGNPGFSAMLASNIPADGAPHAGSVLFSSMPPYVGTSGTLTVSTTTTLCQAAQPVGLGMTATKAGPIATFAATPLVFAPKCGQPAPAAVGLSIMNTGTSALTLSNVKATAGYSIMSVPPGAIGPGMSGTISVTASAPSGEAGGSIRSGTLSFSTDEFGSPGYMVPLSATITGANLAFTDNKGVALSSQPLVCCGSASPCNVWWYCPYTGLTYYITNTGNEAAVLGAPNVSEPLYFGVNALTPSSTVGPGGGMVSSSPNGPDYTAMPPTCSSSGPLNHNETVTYPASGDICVPLGTLTVVLQGNTPC